MSDEGAGAGEYALRWPGTSPTGPPGPDGVDADLEWVDDAPAPTVTDSHHECRDEIERLEALVTELRGELRDLRRKAQVRSTR